MVFYRVLSSFTGTCSLLSFGNPSWSGTPFGSSNNAFIPVKTKKQKNTDKKQTIAFEFEDQFKII